MAVKDACSQENAIAEIRRDVTGISSTLNRLCGSNAELIQEMRDMTKVLTEHMLSNREVSATVSYIRKDQDVLFKRVRRLEDDTCPSRLKDIQGIKEAVIELKDCTEELVAIRKQVKDLEDWQSRVKGVVYIVPGVCAVLTFFMYVSQFVSKKAGG